MKTNKKISLLAVSALAISACVQPQDTVKDLSFSVDGFVDGAQGDTVYLKLIKETGYEFIDSAVVDRSGKFALTGSISKPDFYILHFSNPDNQITLIPDTCEQITLKASYEDFSQNYSVEGSPESEDVCGIISRLTAAKKISDSLGVVFRNNINSKNLPEIKKSLDSAYNAAFSRLRDSSVSYILTHPNSLAQIVCLSQYIAPRTPVFDPDKDSKYYESAAENLTKLYPDNYHTQKLVSYVEKAKLMKRGEKTAPGVIKEGMTAPDIALKNVKGDTVRLSSFKGKYVLLDFWASWSDVSEKNTENIAMIYWKYYNNNFTVFQVSLDDRHDLWKAGLKDQKIPWVSVSDLKNWNSKAALDYGVRQLPASFLIYPDFTVHEMNLAPDDLDDRLEQLVGKPVKKTPKPDGDNDSKTK